MSNITFATYISNTAAVLGYNILWVGYYNKHVVKLMAWGASFIFDLFLTKLVNKVIFCAGLFQFLQKRQLSFLTPCLGQKIPDWFSLSTCFLELM